MLSRMAALTEELRGAFENYQFARFCQARLARPPTRECETRVGREACVCTVHVLTWHSLTQHQRHERLRRTAPPCTELCSLQPAAAELSESAGALLSARRR